jgi:2-polyprenyl-3-methyl-5-hydroxy-6-metoxy-1,4-benzoquinol methylase
VTTGGVEVRAKIGVLTDVVAYILDQASAKSVLNVGAAGGVEHYLPDHRTEWLHHRLGGAARELVGIDIDKANLVWAARHGVEILEADCQTMKLDRRFDLIVMSDVIEHLDAPGVAVRTLVEHLAPRGRLLITTPNPTHYGTMARACLGWAPSVYYDHVACFMPEHVQAICNRYGYRLTAVYFFGHVDRRSLAHTIKSRAARAIGRLSLRLYPSFLTIVEPESLMTDDAGGSRRS